jgi:hypothetical protein
LVAPDDRTLFPLSTPTLLDAERSSESATRERLARATLRTLDEERELAGQVALAGYERMATRARIALASALIEQGRTIEVLGELAARPIDCPAAPARVHATCSNTMAALAVAAPNAIDKRHRVVAMGAVLDDVTSPAAMDELAKQLATSVGTVVVRVRVSATALRKGGLLELDGATRLRVAIAAPEIARAQLGAAADIVWIAFDARSLKRTKLGWDVGRGHMLRVERVQAAATAP